MATRAPVPYDASALDVMLHDPALAERWEELLKTLSGGPWAKTASQWLGRADAVLGERLSDEARRWPPAWFGRAKVPAALPLVRALLLPPLRPADFDAFLERFVALPDDAVPPLTELMTMDYYKVTRGVTAPEAERLWDRFSHARLRDVQLSRGVNCGALIPALHASPALRTVERLSVSLLSDAEALALVSSPHATSLRRLDLFLAEPPGLATAEAFATRQAARVRDLTLAVPSRMALDPEAERRLWSAPWPALVRLNISTLLATPEGLRRALDAAPALGELSLSLDDTSGRAAASMEGATHEALRSLQLFGLRDDATDGRILATPACRGLTRLHLQCAPGAATARTILGLSALETLTLDVKLGDDRGPFWEALRGASLPRLRGLHVGRASGREGFEALATLQLPAIRELSLETEHLTGADLDALEAIPWLSRCRLIGWRFGDDALGARFVELCRAARPADA